MQILPVPVRFHKRSCSGMIYRKCFLFCFILLEGGGGEGHDSLLVTFWVSRPVLSLVSTNSVNTVPKYPPVLDWDRFISWWYQKFKQVVSLNESNILYDANIKNKQALNVTLLIAKFHIFTTSSWDGNLCFEGFLLCLQDKLNVLKESYIAQRKLHKFLNIWGKTTINYYKFHFALSFSFHSRSL